MRTVYIVLPRKEDMIGGRFIALESHDDIANAIEELHNQLGDRVFREAAIVNAIRETTSHGCDTFVPVGRNAAAGSSIQVTLTPPTCALPVCEAIGKYDEWVQFTISVEGLTSDALVCRNVEEAASEIAKTVILASDYEVTELHTRKLQSTCQDILAVFAKGTESFMISNAKCDKLTVTLTNAPTANLILNDNVIGVVPERHSSTKELVAEIEQEVNSYRDYQLLDGHSAWRIALALQSAALSTKILYNGVDAYTGIPRDIVGVVTIERNNNNND